MGNTVIQEEHHHLPLPKKYVVRDSDKKSYMVEGLLGTGGFSAVYRVRERGGEQQVFALKEVIDPGKRERERFIFEWDVLKKLNHPALPQVYRVFENERLKRVYILMRYVDGPNLEALRDEQPNMQFSLALTQALMEPIFSAVSYLHQQNPPIVHRDIKPANIIVPMGGDEAVLVDFSIAKEYIPNGTTTVVRHGSPGYAAPEQYGTGTMPATDIYGLGATLYTLLTGKVPVDALVRLTVSGKVDPLKPVKEMVPDIPREISDAIQRAMSLQSEERFESIDQFWQQIKTYANEQQAPASEVSLLSATSSVHTRVRPLADITTTVVENNKSTIPLVKERRWVPVLAFALVALVLASLLYYSFVLHKAGTPSAPVPPVATHTGLVTGSVASSPTVSLSANAPYSTLAGVYNGTVLDMSNNRKTDLHLTNIVQKGKNIHGFFQGLGIASSFSGTVDTSDHMHFTCSAYSGSTIFVFDGVIQIGGSISGSFAVQNQNGQPTGESGIWSGDPQ